MHIKIIRKTRSLLCLAITWYFQGRDRVFKSVIAEKLGLFSV
jgi:hypothetical protein